MSRVRTREAIEAEEAERLSPCAVRAADSAGRVVPEEEHPYRSAFQRDRDRILHSRAFRRLEYKTQVFVHHEGDHYRNRLTHTLEGAQIARTIARALRLNEDLAEAIVLAHDLGHTPFGHAGERVLNDLLAADGGFDHNRQSLRIVDLLEERYPGFRGLNLTCETREGLLKHGAGFEHPVPLPPATPHASLEARIADFADEIAYTNHDLDDGLRSGLLSWEQLEEVGLWRELRRALDARPDKASESVRRSQLIVGLINRLVTDLVEETARRLDAAGVTSLERVRASESPLVGFSPALARGALELKRFLYLHLYQHREVLRMTRKAEKILGDLFRIYREDPAQLPPHVVARFAADGEARAVADYVAGMTDRFALQEHRKLTDWHEPL
jgi:dGTPase